MARDSPEPFAFTVTVDDRRSASLGNLADDSTETDIRRRYVTRTVQQRRHQQEFRERVLEAYQRHYAVCRLFAAPRMPDGGRRHLCRGPRSKRDIASPQSTLPVRATGGSGPMSILSRVQRRLARCRFGLENS